MAFPEEPPFTQEKLKADLKLCRRMGETLAVIAGIVALVGVISDAVNINLVLEPIIWLLLAIVLVLVAIMPIMTWAVAAHLLAMEAYDKKKK